ncbi:MAG: O-antigen ligase family protein [Deltaproteobacteria bacterium]|nr:O-antigen ligase family protein [Deltaproteobacteria bacterium]
MSYQLSSIPLYLIYALLIFTPLARGSVQPWAVTVIHIVTLVALAAFLIEKTWKQNWQWIKTPLDLPLLILLILVILSTLFSLLPKISTWSLILLINYLTIFYLTIHTNRTRTQSKRLIFIIIGVATFLAVFGLFKKFGMNPFPWWEYGELKYNPDWLSSTYGNHNHFAGYMEMSIPLVLGLFLLGYRSGKLFILVYITLLILTSLILSLSRGGWIGTLLGLVFITIALFSSRYFKRKKLLIISIAGFIVLALIVLASTPVVERIRTLENDVEEPSFEGRVSAWSGVIEMIRDHPLLGTGPGTFASVFTRYQPPGHAARYFYAHNDYLHFISETGLILIPIIIWMIIAVYRRGFHKLKNSSRFARGTTLGALTGITAILVHSIVDFNLHIPANAILFTILTAIVAAPLPVKEEK